MGNADRVRIGFEGRQPLPETVQAGLDKVSRRQAKGLRHAAENGRAPAPRRCNAGLDLLRKAAGLSHKPLEACATSD